MNLETGAVLAIVVYTAWQVFWYGIIGNLAHAHRVKTFKAADEA